jgi:hypothetical protein
MKEQRKGILNVEVAFVKTDPLLLKKLYERINFEAGYEETEEKWMTEVEVRNLMRYNVWTVEQFGNVSGLSVSTITNLTRPFFIGENSDAVDVKLDICFPFSDAEGKGPKFIVRNQKSEKYIKV